MINNYLSSGSKWTKWDLHIHSPLSGLNNQYPKKTDGIPDWEQFLNKLEEINDISVIAITDYFTVEGYKKILEFAKNGRLKNYKLILPNIEFRLDNILSSKKDSKPRRLTLHLIFSNEISPEIIEEQFLHELEFCYEGNPFAADEKRKLKRSSLENLGSKLKSEHSSFEKMSDFEVGCMTATVNHEKITQILEDKPSIFKNKYLIILAEEYTNLIDWDSQDHLIRKVLLQKSSCIFTGNPNTIKWALGKLDLSPKEFEKEFKSLKPCIFGSDAHSLDKIGKPENNKFTWIKTEPTFEGLRQIIYEPNLRINIAEKPELYLYPQILSIYFKGTDKYQNKKNKTEFPPINLKEPVYLNSNLNTIIGPRASGKTVLAELLSYPFNKHSKELKKDERLPLIQYLAKKFPELSIEIKYKQGENKPKIIERNIKEYTNPLYSSPLTIEYWPQGKLEQFADDKEKINEYLSNRLTSPKLLQTSSDIDELHKKLQTLRKKYISKFEFEIEHNHLLAEKKEIEEYFQKLKAKEYINIVNRINENKNKTQLLDTFLENLDSIIEIFININEQVSFISKPDINELLKLYSDDSQLIQEIKNYYTLTEVDLSKNIENFQNLKNKIIASEVRNNLIFEAKKYKDDFIEYCNNNGINITQQEYEKQTNLLDSIKSRLREIDFQMKECNSAKKLHKNLSEELNLKLKQWKDENDKLIEEFNSLYRESNIKIIWDDPTQDLTKSITREFKNSDDDAKLFINKHYAIASPVREDFISEIIEEMVFDKTYSIVQIIEFLQNKQIPKLFKSKGKGENLNWYFQKDETEIIREILIMRLQEFSEKGINLIQYKNKILGKDSTSFGERCGTVIELILHSGFHPLIIDQPEEHLDAKYIADRVVEIVRKQKLNRQIIICTHNANIVVLCDSELITILSINQDGTKYYQGSLENLENKKKIFDILEGGPEAFRKREQKYFSIL